MKVLILHQHFKTPQAGGAIRSYYLASALAERGVETVVITTYNGTALKTETTDGIKIHYLPISYDNRFGFYRRIFSFLQFMYKSVEIAAQHRDASVCYAVSTPLTTGIAAQRIKRNYGIPYVFEVGDLWPDAPVQMGFIKSPWIKHLLYRMEKAIYRNASSIVALSEPIRRAIETKVEGLTVDVIPNMADTEFFRAEKKQATLEQKFGVKGKFVVSYIGALGVANGLTRLLDCAAASQRAGLAIHFVLCGDGAMADELKRYASKLELRNTTFVGFQNRRGVRDLMNVTDANFISYETVKILETGSPNKYFDGLAAGKLTIINFGGWIREEIERMQCGVYVDPHSPEEFISKIKMFVDNASLMNGYRDAGRRLAEQKYSRVALAEKFRQVLSAHLKQ